MCRAIGVGAVADETCMMLALMGSSVVVLVHVLDTNSAVGDVELHGWW